MTSPRAEGFTGQGWVPGSSPSRIQGTLRRDGVGKREREQMNVAVKKVEERKRLIFLGLPRKLIKFQDKKLAPSTLGHRCPLEYLRVPRLGLPLAWVLEAPANK